MLRIRWLGLAAIALGFLLGLVFPFPHVSTANVGDTITVYMEPTTRSSGLSAFNTCGWHDECTESGNPGPALDWDDGGDFGSAWYFRSWNYTSRSGGLILVARGIPLVYQTGGTTCEAMTVWIAEKTSGPLRAIPVYTHTDITNSAVFYIYARVYYGNYVSRQIGTTVNDNRANCTNTGSHVHEWDIPYGSTSYSRNGNYPTLDTCSYPEVPDGCHSYTNNNVNNYTRWFQWKEGQ